MPEPQPVLIARSLALGLIAAVIVAAVVAGICKLVAPSVDAGSPVLVVGLFVLVATTAVRVRRGDISRSAD